MEQISQIIGNKDLFQVKDSGSNNIITSLEAEKSGIKCKSKAPEPKTCKYCGKPLYHEGIILNGQVVFWKPNPQHCTCDKAQKYWTTVDENKRSAKEQEEMTQNRVQMQNKINRLLGKSGLKKRFLNRTFENFICKTPNQKIAFMTAKKYADKFQEYFERGIGLYIEGTNGTGKTHLAAAISLQLINKGVPVVCKTSIELLDDIKRAFDANKTNEFEVISVYKQVDLLIIDDLGKEQCTDWSMSTLYSILNDRYEDMKPTIITTNYNEDSLIKNMTPKGSDNEKIVAIISRLREISTVITMAWEDYRGDCNER
ncbi:MAG: ATP-binding protein [Sedimentibacter sp.]